MARFETSLRRLILAGGFAIAVAATPAIAALAVPSQEGPSHQAIPASTCSSGEEEDLYTNVCVPHTVPSSPSPFSVSAANPDFATIDNVPCTGHNYGECVGLEQNAPKYVPPTSTVDGTPNG